MNRLSRTLAVRRVSPFFPRWNPPSKDYDPQFGDYPNLPWIPFDKRDPYVHWDDPVHRRNFGEVIHEEFDVQDGFFQGEHEPSSDFMSGLKGQGIIFAMLGGFLFTAYLLKSLRQDIAPRTLPPEVQSYLENKGQELIKNRRPYETPKLPPVETFVNNDYKYFIQH
jgi:hypothetical protein